MSRKRRNRPLTGPMSEVDIPLIQRSVGIAGDPKDWRIPEDVHDALMVMGMTTEPQALAMFREEVKTGAMALGGVDSLPSFVLVWWMCGFKAGLEARDGK